MVWMGTMPKTTSAEEAFQALLEGRLEQAPRRVIDLAKLAVALEPATRPEPPAQFKARLRKELLAQAAQDATAEEEAFAALLDGTLADAPVEMVPMARLATAMAATAAPAVPSPAFRFQTRNALIAAASPQAVSGVLSRINTRLTRSLRAVGATGLAAALMLSSGAALAASHDSLPGDAVAYKVKRFRESAQLLVTSGPIKGTRLLEFARTRLHEVKGLADRADLRQHLYVDTLGDMDVETLEGTSILIDSFRRDHTRSALEQVTSFARAQSRDLTALIDRLPPGARPAAQDSLITVQRVGDRVDLVLRGCPCPDNSLVQPSISEGSAPAVGCGCETPAPTGSSGNGETTSPSGAPTQPAPNPPAPAPAPAPSGSAGPISSTAPDVPGSTDDQLEQQIDDLLNQLGINPTPAPAPTSALPALPIPEVSPTSLPILPPAPSSPVPGLPTLL